MAAAAAAGDGGGGATIARLSKEAVSAIRSGISVPSLAQAVEELVANAIDAKARTVTCRINLSNFSVQVDDDGSGIKEQDLPLIGKRYHTSKCQQLHDLNSKVTSYGFRGEALASLRDVGALNIITRTAEAHSVTRQCKLDAKTAAVGMAATQRATAGTTIIISDLFKTSPVRRKCITSGDIEEARRRVETIALAHTNVAFALYNAATGQQLLRVARADSAASTFEQIFGTDKSAHLVPVTRTVGPITVSGHVSVGSHHNRHLQFLYINKRHVYATKFHKLINQLLPLPYVFMPSRTTLHPNTCCLLHAAAVRSFVASCAFVLSFLGRLLLLLPTNLLMLFKSQRRRPPFVGTRRLVAGLTTRMPQRQRRREPAGGAQSL